MHNVLFLNFSNGVTNNKVKRFLLVCGSQTRQAKSIAEIIEEKSVKAGLSPDLHCFSESEKRVWPRTVASPARRTRVLGRACVRVSVPFIPATFTRSFDSRSTWR